jgi:hypothetical protein
MSKGFSKYYILPFYFVFIILCSHIYSLLAFPPLQATRAHFANIRIKKKDQIEAGLRRKEAQVVESEQREAKALERFMAKKNYEVFHSLADLRAELQEKHQSGKPLYTPAMQVEIVVAQIQYRRDCLLRTLRPGSLCSNIKSVERRLDALMENFATIIEDEHMFPSLLQPPQIRRVYQSHPFANEARKTLDDDRNTITREMTRHFMETYTGGVFIAWRCSVDYAKSYPLNPGL